MTSVNNVAIVPVNVFWKMEQTETLDFAGIAVPALGGRHLTMYTAMDETAHYLWFDVDGMSSDPSPAGKTGITVDLLSTDSAKQTATKTADALNLIAGFKAEAKGAMVIVKRTAVGETTMTSDVDSGVVVTLTRRGRDMDLGLLQGDVELKASPKNYDVTTHQTGTSIVAAIHQGFEVSCTTTMIETQKSNLKEIYKIYGGAMTPVGGKEVFGIGSAAQGKNMMSEAGRLVLKPVNAEGNDENFSIMLVIPVPDSLVFSGENPKTLSVTWQGFVDQNFNSKFNTIAIGDVEQVGL